MKVDETKVCLTRASVRSLVNRYRWISLWRIGVVFVGRVDEDEPGAQPGPVNSRYLQRKCIGQCTDVALKMGNIYEIWLELATFGYRFDLKPLDSHLWHARGAGHELCQKVFDWHGAEEVASHLFSYQ